MAAAVLAAAERTGAPLVTVSNLYGYGRVDGPMTEDQSMRPAGRKGAVRARMWADALAAHRAGRVRACEVRASDYTGPGATGQSVLNGLVIDPVRRGRAVWLPFGDPDAPHTWTSVEDTGRLAARLVGDERAWGRAWHVPSAPARSVRQVAVEVAELVGGPTPRVHRLPRALVDAAGLVVPLLRELRETRHEFEAPFVLDGRRTEETFGVAATPWEEVLAATVRSLAGSGGGPGGDGLRSPTAA